MTDKKLNRLVTTFLEERSGQYTIKEFNAYLKDLGDEYQYEDLPQSFLKAFISQGYYNPSHDTFYPIDQFLEQGQFIIELTAQERNGEYLLAGNRFLGFTDWLDTGPEITLVDHQGKEIPKKPKQAYIKNIQKAYSFTDIDELIGILIEEQPDNYPIFQDPDPDQDIGDVKVHVTCWDLKPFIKSTKVKLNEPLTLTLEDYKQGIFRIDGFLPPGSKTETRTSEEITKSYVQAMDEALLMVLDQLGPGYPMSWVVIFGMMQNPQILMRVVPVTFEQYLEKTKKIFLVEETGRPQLWHKQSIDAVDQELQEPTFNQLLISQGIHYTETEVVAILRDMLFDRKESYEDLITHYFNPPKGYHFTKETKLEFSQYTQELWDEVTKEYNFFADQQRGPLRKELLEVTQEIVRFLTFLREQDYAYHHLPPEVYEIFHIKHLVSNSLKSLNNDEPDTPEDLETYDHMSEATEQMMDSVEHLANLVIKSIRQDLQNLMAKTKNSQNSKSAAKSSLKSTSISGSKKSKKGTTLPPPKSWLQLKVTLHEMKPPVWRRILVPDNLSLAELHEAIQISMGWENCHLHEFIIDKVHYCDPREIEPIPEIIQENELNFRLSDFSLQEKSRFIYVYDYGDNWEHRIQVEKILPLDQPPPLGQRVFCIKGKGPCPPEDCGGVYRFQGIIEALNDRQHPHHQVYWEDYGFVLKLSLDLRGINKELEVFGKGS